MTNNMTIAVDLGKDVTYELMIEQLGGYEKMSKYVKDTLADLENDVPYDTNCYQFETEICFQFGQLQKALLEYRRAHNIFEVGDQIAYLPKCAPEHNDIYEVREVHQSWCLVVLEDMDHRAIYTNIRHTTDAEREANRRLDQ